MFENCNDILTVKEVHSILKIGKNMLYNLLQDGTLKSIRFGRKYLIPKQFLIDFVNAYR